MEVFLAIGCYRYQGQEVLNVYDNYAAALADCDQQKDAFNETYVIARTVETDVVPLKGD